jgi:hypothetical protein
MANAHLLLLYTIAVASACSPERSAPSGGRETASLGLIDSELTQGRGRARDTARVADGLPTRSRGSSTEAEVDSATMDSCPPTRGGQVRISQHCVGPIAWDSTLGDIRRHFPKLVEAGAYLEATPIVTWTFAFGRVTIVASQQDDKMNPDSPADYWIVSGDGIILPGGGRLPVVWGDFRKRYSHGLSVASGELGITASTCQMPGLDFALFIDPRLSVVSLEVDSIPADTRIVQVLLDRGHPPSDSLVSC